jgi:hypothetical protein
MAAAKKKTSTLILATKTPGTCAECRHSNQGTADFAEGHAFCWMDKNPKRREQTCDVVRPLPKSASDPVAKWSPYFLYEPYDGENGTYDRATDLRIIAEDADEPLKRSLRANVPVIES